MEKKFKKIAVCGDEDTCAVVRESLKSISEFEIVGSDKIKQSDVIYWLSGKGPSMMKYFIVWIKKDPLIINHWIGSDVTNEIEIYYHGDRIHNFIRDFISRWKLKRGGLINLAVSPWLVDELVKIHINATYLPITTIDKNKMETVGNQKGKNIDFLSYVLVRRFDFYGGDKIVKLAERWKNYQFLIILADLNEIPPDFIENMPRNLTFSPRVTRKKMAELYQRSKFFIRYTQHDGLSLSVLEALYYNLQVVWTYDFPYTLKIEDQEKFSDSIPSLVNNWQPNHNGHTFVTENFSIDMWKTNFLKIIQHNLPQNKKD
jgi:hypothetical protein